MARTIDQINQSILDKLTVTPALAGLTSTSTVSIFRLVAYVVAGTIWTLETLFDRHRAETDEKMAVAKPGTAAWYARIVKQFQQGDTLILRRASPFKPTRPEDVAGSLHYDGPPVSIEDMNKAIETMVKERHARGRY